MSLKTIKHTMSQIGGLGVPNASVIQAFRGRSAYEIAVANGFVGNESQWLSYLVGPAINEPEYYGPIGTGNDTAAILACINANKGKRVVLRGDYYASAIILEGSSYDNTTIEIIGTVKLIPAATQFQNNWSGGGWNLFVFADCNNCCIVGNIDGNRANQQIREQTFALRLAGVTNFTIPWIDIKEVRGDGIYIGMLSGSSNSKRSDNITLGNILVTNAEAGDGRNGISVTDCKTISIGQLTSLNVGGTVVGSVGGLDVEPNRSWEAIDNLTIGSMNIISGGNACYRITAKACTIGNITCENTVQPDYQDSNGNWTQTLSSLGRITSCDMVSIGPVVGKFTYAYGRGLVISDSRVVDMPSVKMSKCKVGAEIAIGDLDVAGAGCSDINVRLMIDDISQFGIQTGKLTRAKISGRVSNPQAAYYTSKRGVVAGAISTINPAPHTDVHWSVEVEPSAVWSRTYSNDPTFPATFAGQCSISNIDLSGAYANNTAQVGDIVVPRYNVKGVTNRTAIPVGAATLYVVGQNCINESGVVGQPTGWRMSSGGAWIALPNL